MGHSGCIAKNRDGEWQKRKKDESNHEIQKGTLHRYKEWCIETDYPRQAAPDLRGKRSGERNITSVTVCNDKVPDVLGGLELIR